MSGEFQFISRDDNLYYQGDDIILRWRFSGSENETDGSGPRREMRLQLSGRTNQGVVKEIDWDHIGGYTENGENNGLNANLAINMDGTIPDTGDLFSDNITYQDGTSPTPSGNAVPVVQIRVVGWAKGSPVPVLTTLSLTMTTDDQDGTPQQTHTRAVTFYQGGPKSQSKDIQAKFPGSLVFNLRSKQFVEGGDGTNTTDIDAEDGFVNDGHDITGNIQSNVQAYRIALFVSGNIPVDLKNITFGNGTASTGLTMVEDFTVSNFSASRQQPRRQSSDQAEGVFGQDGKLLGERFKVAGPVASNQSIPFSMTGLVGASGYSPSAIILYAVSYDEDGAVLDYKSFTFTNSPVSRWTEVSYIKQEDAPQVNTTDITIKSPEDGKMLDASQFVQAQENQDQLVGTVQSVSLHLDLPVTVDIPVTHDSVKVYLFELESDADLIPPDVIGLDQSKLGTQQFRIRTGRDINFNPGRGMLSYHGTELNYALLVLAYKGNKLVAEAMSSFGLIGAWGEGTSPKYKLKYYFPLKAFQSNARWTMANGKVALIPVPSSVTPPTVSQPMTDYVPTTPPPSTPPTKDPDPPTNPGDGDDGGGSTGNNPPTPQPTIGQFFGPNLTQLWGPLVVTSSLADLAKQYQNDDEGLSYKDYLNQHQDKLSFWLPLRKEEVTGLDEYHCATGFVAHTYDPDKDVALYDRDDYYPFFEDGDPSKSVFWKRFLDSWADQYTPFKDWRTYDTENPPVSGAYGRARQRWEAVLVDEQSGRTLGVLSDFTGLRMSAALNSAGTVDFTIREGNPLLNYLRTKLDGKTNPYFQVYRSYYLPNGSTAMDRVEYLDFDLERKSHDPADEDEGLASWTFSGNVVGKRLDESEVPYINGENVGTVYSNKTPGFIVRDVLNKLQRLGCLTGFVADFTDLDDSAGFPWQPVQSYTVSPGSTVLGVLQDLSDKFNLLTFRLRGFSIEAYNYNTLGVDRTSSVVLEVGMHVSNGPMETTLAEQATDVQVYNGLVTSRKGSNADAESRGRVILKTRSQNGITSADALSAFSTLLLEQLRKLRQQLTFGVVVTDDAPLVFDAYMLGDYISYYADGRYQPDQVTTVAIEVDEDEQETQNVLFGALFQTQGDALAARLQAVEDAANAFG